MPSPVLMLDRAGKWFEPVLRTVSQEELGDIVYVELPEVGSEVKHKEQFGVVKSVKAGILTAQLLQPRHALPLIAGSIQLCMP